MSDIQSQVEQLMEMFRYENLKRHPRGLPYTVQRRIASLVQQKELSTPSQDGIRIEQVHQLRGQRSASSEFRVINFLAELGNYMLSSYLVVLCAIETQI